MTSSFGQLARNERFGLEVPAGADDTSVRAFCRAGSQVMIWMHLLALRSEIEPHLREGRALRFNIFDVAPDGRTVFVELELVDRHGDPAGTDVFKARFVLMALAGKRPQVGRAPWTLEDIKRMTRLGELVVERRSEIRWS
jgi:hypothetical protein